MPRCLVELYSGCFRGDVFLDVINALIRELVSKADSPPRVGGPHQISRRPAWNKDRLPQEQERVLPALCLWVLQVSPSFQPANQSPPPCPTGFLDLLSLPVHEPISDYL